MISRLKCIPTVGGPGEARDFEDFFSRSVFLAVRNGWSTWLQERTRVKQKQWTFQEIPRPIGGEKSIPVNLHKHIWIFTIHLWRRPVLAREKRTLLKIDTSSRWNRYFSRSFEYFFLVFIETLNWSEASEILWNIRGKILQAFLEIYIFSRDK